MTSYLPTKWGESCIESSNNYNNFQRKLKYPPISLEPTLQEEESLFALAYNQGTHFNSKLEKLMNHP